MICACQLVLIFLIQSKYITKEIQFLTYVWICAKYSLTITNFKDQDMPVQRKVIPQPMILILSLNINKAEFMKNDVLTQSWHKSIAIDFKLNVKQTFSHNRNVIGTWKHNEKINVHIYFPNVSGMSVPWEVKILCR